MIYVYFENNFQHWKGDDEMLIMAHATFYDDRTKKVLFMDENGLREGNYHVNLKNKSYPLSVSKIPRTYEDMLAVVKKDLPELWL